MPTESFLSTLDWTVIGVYCLAILLIGFFLKKKAGSGTESYFLSGRSLPWWLAGTSMAATTFASDTPLFVTGLIRSKGLAGNWAWWCLGISHVLAIFFFSRLWRRAGVLTEVEYCELRYDGKPAAVLRGFKAVYFGLIINCFVIGAWPLMGLSKVMEVSTGWNKLTAVLICGGIALAYSVFSGFWGVVVTDLIQFVIAMAGAFILMFAALGHPAVGGLAGIKKHFAGSTTVSFFPEWGSEAMYLLIGFMLIQWWANKNADGGGIIVQRMSACKNEKESMKATLWFCVAHYILRAWPWILVALASMIILPTVTNVHGVVDNEMAYPRLMMDLLPVGVKGLLVASFLAAFMSTVDTHLNWGASYMVNDLYRRFVKKEASDSHYVSVSRWTTIALMAIAGIVAMFATSIESAFYYILYFTAGVGVVYILRWFWWRVNAWTELTAMVVTGLVSIPMIPSGESVLSISKLLGNHLGLGARTGGLLVNVAITFAVALIVTLLTRPVAQPRLIHFYRRVRPFGPGWARIARLADENGVATSMIPDLINWGIGVGFLYTGLYGVGTALLSSVLEGMIFVAISAVLFGILWVRLFPSEPGGESVAAAEG